VYTDDAWQQYEADVISSVLKRVPDLQVVLALLKASTSSTTTSSNNVHSEQVNMIYERTLCVLGLYQQHFPETLIKARFDVGKCLPLRLASCPSGIRNHLLNLLLGAGNTLQWTSKSMTHTIYTIYTKVIIQHI
jgi:hypothetical protein